MSRDLTTYPAYKDSGVEWLGKIPEHWKTKRLKREFKITNGATPKSSEESYWDGDIPWVTPEDLGSLEGRTIAVTARSITKAGYENCGTSLVPKGSVVLSTRAPIGHLALAEVPLCTNQGCRSLVSRRDQSMRFFFYQLVAANPELQSWGQGSTFIELSKTKLEGIFLASPPAHEQRTIASFLDRETAKIDALVAKKEQLIELLQEKRAALITHAVTKGLDPTAPMKDSGVEWLGQIPAPWTVSPVRRFLERIEQGWSPVAEDRVATHEEWAVLKLSAVAKGKFRQEEHKALPENVPPEVRYQVRSGDFLLTRANTPELVGDVCVVRTTRPRLMLSDLVYRIGFDLQQVELSFLCYWFLSTTGRYQTTRDARGSSQSMVKVSGEHIRSWLTPLPPLQEQRAIALFLDGETAKLDALIARVLEGIERLKEYRTALISAAVTGKIDVREPLAQSSQTKTASQQDSAAT